MTTPAAGTGAVPTARVHGRRAAGVLRDDAETSAADAATASRIANAAEPSSAPIGRRASRPTGRRAAEPADRPTAEPTGRRAAAPVRPDVAPGAHRTHPTRAEQPAANRAKRRRRRSPRRPAKRVAKGVVAVGLALGVGGFAIVPGATDRSPARVPALADAEPDTGVATGAARLTPQIVQERVSAVALASATAQQAGSVAADAAASAVSAESLTALNAAVAELDTLIVATQSAQPALSELQPSRTPSPVVPSDALIAPVDSAAEASAAADDGAAVASDAVIAAPSAAGARPPAATPGGAPSTASPAAPGTETAAEPPIDAATAQLHAAAAKVTTLTAELQVLTQQQQEAAAAADEVARKEAQRASLDAFENGKIPASALCELGFARGQQLRCDAAEALEQLNATFAAAMGTNLVISDSYRSHGEQVACRQHKGSLCATPGTSNHGNGTAVDLGGRAGSFGTDQHNWLRAHAEEFGWTLPDWARASGAKPEPWHWEFVG